MMNALVLGFLITLLTLSSPALAKDPKELGEYGAWKAYTYDEDGNTICYMVATPADSKGDYKKRGSVYAMITHRPADKAIGVFSYLSGYTYTNGSKVTLSIDGQPIALFGAGEVAWTSSEDVDRKLVAALRKGSKMVVEGSSDRGTATKDTYSLKGSGSAYDAISKVCKITQ